MLPLLLELTEDPDRDVCRCVLQTLISYDTFRDPTALPVLRRRLDDSDSLCRIKAASAIWLIDRQEPVLELMLREIEDRQNGNWGMAICHLAFWTQRDPDLFAHLAKYANDPDAEIRAHVMLFMQGQGDKAIPILCQGADDRSSLVRQMALNSLGLVDSRPREVVPLLIRLLSDHDKKVRNYSAEAIRRIDRERYQQLRGERKIE
jgi:HEAT repeats